MHWLSYPLNAVNTLNVSIRLYRFFSIINYPKVLLSSAVDRFAHHPQSVAISKGKVLLLARG
jgi:hypothetical protein